MDSEANKAVVKRYIEMWNTGNVALADEVLATDVCGSCASRGNWP